MRGEYVPRTWSWNPRLHAPARYRRACRYEAFVPHSINGFTFELSATLAGVVSDAEQAILKLNNDAEPALAPLARLLLRTESIASSKVEGLQIGVRQLARAESRLETGGGISPTALEVIGNIDAMRLAVEEAAGTEEIGVDHLCTIHRALMANTANAEIAGVIRSEQNWIGGNDYNPCGANFVPPPPEEVRRLLDDLCRAIRDDSLPPIIQAAIVHAQFETIHPFADGNGRAGRALIHVVLRRRNISPSYVPPISVLLARRRERYIEGLTNFRRGLLSEWIEQFSSVSATAARLAEDYLRSVRELMVEWRRMLSEKHAPRSDAVAWALIELLPAHPVITSTAAEAITNRTKAAIHHAIIQLTECGVLVPVSKAKRNRSWEAAGLLDLVEEFEAP